MLDHLVANRPNVGPSLVKWILTQCVNSRGVTELLTPFYAGGSSRGVRDIHLAPTGEYFQSAYVPVTQALPHSQQNP